MAALRVAALTLSVMMMMMMMMMMGTAVLMFIQQNCFTLSQESLSPCLEPVCNGGLDLEELETGTNSSNMKSNTSTSSCQI